MPLCDALPIPELPLEVPLWSLEVEDPIELPEPLCELPVCELDWLLVEGVVWLLDDELV